MYNEMMKTFKEQMAPFNTIAEINKKTAEKLIELQSAYAAELVNAGLAQFKALTETKEPKAAFDLQISFFKEMENKLTSVAEEELAAISTAREELTSVFEDSLKTLAETDYAKEMAAFDISKLVPATEAEKPAAKTTTRKAPAPKAAAAAE